MSRCKRYDLAEQQIKAFTRSSIRAKIMLCLKDGPKASAEMENIIGTRSTTILHAISDMSKADIVRRTSNGYALTNIGKVQALILDDLVSSIVALDEHREFWLTHNISGIPEELQKKIGVLTQSDLIIQDPAAILKSHEYFLQKLVQAKEIYGVSPIIAPGHAEVIRKLIKNGIMIELILTDNILEIVARENPDMGSLLSHDNFKLYKLDEDVKVAFTVTDSMLSLGLYRLDGAYDLGRDLFCIGEEAISWGMELFEHYRNRAKQVSCL